ncbi:hypothetical protein MPTA5024_14730 [Microbispora sp. ATCC PTA-5024]|nr:hypothetical protein MPTA5024_14730 [Microbispora sp. ATCC PTA-5024]
MKCEPRDSYRGGEGRSPAEEGGTGVGFTEHVRTIMAGSPAVIEAVAIRAGRV